MRIPRRRRRRLASAVHLQARRRAQRRQRRRLRVQARVNQLDAHRARASRPVLHRERARDPERPERAQDAKFILARVIPDRRRERRRVGRHSATRCRARRRRKANRRSTSTPS